MKKKSKLYVEEIDLNNLIRIIYKDKIKLILIVIISYFIGIVTLLRYQTITLIR